jgi:hypothetical protein
VVPTDYDTILSIDKDMSERSSKVHSAHVDGCNNSESSAVPPGVRPKPRRLVKMEGVAAAPRIKRRHSLRSAGRRLPTLSRPSRPSAIRLDSYTVGEESRRNFNQLTPFRSKRLWHTEPHYLPHVPTIAAMAANQLT